MTTDYKTWAAADAARETATQAARKPTPDIPRGTLVHWDDPRGRHTRLYGLTEGRNPAGDPYVRAFANQRHQYTMPTDAVAVVLARPDLNRLLDALTALQPATRTAFVDQLASFAAGTSR